MIVASEVHRISSVLLTFGAATYDTEVAGIVQFGW